MATYESLIQLNGTIGDLVFYKLNGKNVVRKKSGFNKNAFKKSASYEKVRQNSSEFGHCSKVGKLIRSCISKYIAKAGDPLLYQKFAKLMTAVKDLDENEKGKRTVLMGLQTEAGKELLRNFEFGNTPNLKDKIQFKNTLSNDVLELHDSFEATEIYCVSIKIDLENDQSEFVEEKLEVEIPPKEYRLKKNFSEDKDVLYFVAAKSGSMVAAMGFV